MPESLSSAIAACAPYLPPLVLLWLAYFFARTLRSGTVPLVERIARAGKPVLSAALCRYTRRLTAIWSSYFVAAAVLTVALHVAVDAGARAFGPAVAAASTLLFVGEYFVRRRLFPAERFPGLVQQLRDTVGVWRPRPRR